MIIYSVTVSIAPHIEEDWKNWMLKNHIPDVMKTGVFIDKKMTKVIEGHEEGTINYNIQYTCKSIKKLEEYQNNFADKLQKEHGERYKDNFIAFRTVLEIIE